MTINMGKKPLKILFVLSSLQGGGAEKVAVQLLTHLSPDKYALKVTLLENNGAFLKDIPPGVEIIYLHKKSRMDWLILLIKLSHIFRQEKPDIILSFLDYANILSVLARWLAHTSSPLIITEHTVTSKYLPSTRLAGLRHLLIKTLYKKADRIVAVSQGVRNDLQYNFAVPTEKLRVVHNSIDFSVIREMLNQSPQHLWYSQKDQPIIIAIGRLVPYKRYDIILKAFAKVRKIIPCRLVILGEGPLLQELMELSRTLEISDDVAFLGFQSNPYSFLTRSDVLVLTSDFEGFGNVIVEAMACGVPVVATRCPFGPGEIITNKLNGLLVPIGDIEAISNSLRTVLQNHSLREPLAIEGEKRANDFTLEIMINAYEKLFTEALDINL